MIQYISNFDGTPGSTVRLALTTDGTTAIIDTEVPLTSGGKNISMLIISVETAAARICFFEDATQTLGHYRDIGESMQISGHAAIKQLTFANAVAGANTVLQLTPFY